MKRKAKHKDSLEIASHKVVIPGLIELEENNDKTVKNIFADSIRKNAKSWKEIITKIEEELGKM